MRTTIDGENTRLRVCVKCLKAGKVQRVAGVNRVLNVEQNPF